MEVLFVLVPLGVLVALVAGALFLVAATGGQFEDLEAPANDILADDASPTPPA